MLHVLMCRKKYYLNKKIKFNFSYSISQKHVWKCILFKKWILNLTLITYLFLSIFITPQKYTNKTLITICLLPLREQKQHFCRFVCKFECCTMPRVVLSDALKYLSMFNFVLQSLSSISCTTILCVLIHKSTYRHVFKKRYVVQ